MKFDIAAIFAQLVAGYVKLPLAQKLAIPLLVAASMGLIVFVSRWATSPDYRTLYSGLGESDAAAVVEKLKDQKVLFRLMDEGRRIEVSPPSSVDQLRLELASAGIPKGGTVGFERLDQNFLGRTGFMERLDWLRALQGELERTILSIDAVKSVRVHVTNPERSSFVKKDALPTASVLLKLKIGAELSTAQVKGIANLVASSVERLTPENVRVIDSKGNLLNEKREEKDGGVTDVTQLDYKTKFESAYARQIESLLGGVLGPAKAIARVTAEIDFNAFQKEEEAYDPGSRVARSERSIEERAGMTADGGVPGVMSNLTNDPGVLTQPDERQNNNRRVETVRNYEVSRAVSKTITAPGKVQRLSVAVLVDGQYQQEPTGKKNPDGTPATQKMYKPLTADMMQKIENLVKQTVGFDGTRGDTVTVENIRFFEPDETLADQFKKTEFLDQMRGWSQLIVPALLVLLFIYVVMKPMIKALINPVQAEVDLSRLLPTGIEELEAELETERGKATAMPHVAQPAVDIEELESLMAENSRVVKDNPQQAALLIRYWLNEGRM